MVKRAESFQITDLRQIKALADPLRQRILGAMSGEPRTTKQIATLLDQPATKLYHHVDQLEKVGLLRLIESRPKRGTTEKYFQAVAREFTVGRSSLSTESASVIEEMFSTVFAEAVSQVRRSVVTGSLEPEGKKGKTMLASGYLRLTAEDYKEMQSRLAAVLTEFRERKKDDSGTYRVLVATFPLGEEDKC